MTTAAYRRRARSSSGSRWMQLRYPGDCKMCGEHLAAGATAYWDSATHRITCEDLECCERDGLTREETVWDGTAAGRRVTVRADRRIGQAAPDVVVRANARLHEVAPSSPMRTCSRNRSVQRYGLETAEQAAVDVRLPGRAGSA